MVARCMNLTKQPFTLKARITIGTLTAIDDEQVQGPYPEPVDTVSRIGVDTLNRATVLEYLRLLFSAAKGSCQGFGC